MTAPAAPAALPSFPPTEAELRLEALEARLRETEERLRESEERLTQGRAEEFAQQLMGVVSHDLRNPIAAILAAAGSLQRRNDLDARTLKALSVIVSSGERASRLIRDLLDFSRARLEGGLPVTRRALDFHVVVRGAVEEVRLAHPGRTFLLAEEGDGAGTWDGDRLAQVVVNLVSNAVAYSPEDAPVRVETRGEGMEVVLRVHNRGPPIAESLLPGLFAPFRRGEGERRNSGGVGLGLFIVDQLVRAHGGRVTAESTEAAGTTFTVRLPRR